MPSYNPSPFKAALALLAPGVVGYLFGSWNQDASPTQMYVTSTALAGGVATLGVTVYGGNAPVVGGLISVQGTQTSGGQFNVVNKAITAVTLNGAGVGTVQFALAGTAQTTTADAGISVVPVSEIAEAIVNGASVAIAAPNNSFGGDLDRTVTAVAAFQNLPTAVTVALQGAMFDQDAQYQTLGTIATVSGGAVAQPDGLTVVATWMFYRALVSGLNGTGSMTVKIAN